MILPNTGHLLKCYQCAKPPTICLTYGAKLSLSSNDIAVENNELFSIYCFRQSTHQINML